LGGAFCFRRFAVLKAVRVFCDALERILSGTSGNQQTECENVSFARR